MNDLYIGSLHSFQYDDALLSRIKQVSDLLPEEALDRLSVRTVRDRLERALTKAEWTDERSEALDALKKKIGEGQRPDDEDVEPVWGWRAKADRSIRRSRFADVAALYAQLGEEDVLWRRCDALPGMDQIAVCNLLLMGQFASQHRWFEIWQEWGAFDAGVEHFYACAKTVSNWLKRQKPIDFDRWSFIEVGGLVGYRNPPYPGFNKLEQARALAHSGNAEGGLFPDDRRAEFWSASSVLDVAPERVEAADAQTFVKEGRWDTSGASSIGRVEWEHNGEGGKSFKARKNLVRDVLSYAQVWALMLLWAVQVSWTIVKAELAKLRIAVAGDMITYLWMSWVMYHVNSAYKKWPYATIEEDYTQQTKRQLATWEGLRSTWHVPIDADKFDHQPDLDELKMIDRRLGDIALKNSYPEYRDQLAWAADRMVETNDRMTLITTMTAADMDGMSFDGGVKDGGMYVFEDAVTGGLQSGRRDTSAVGNGWMTVQLSRAEELMAQLGLRGMLQDGKVRGDDTDAAASTYIRCLFIFICYIAHGVKVGPGKFGVLKSETEFLRVFYTVNGLFGYLARAVPGATQSKPWSNAPMDDEAVMRALYDNTMVMRRRHANQAAVDAWWLVLKRGWSRRRKTRVAWLAIPRSCGGLGIEPAISSWENSKPWKGVTGKGIRVTNMAGWSTELVAAEFADWNISPTEADALAQMRAAGKIVADDVPQAKKAAFQDTGAPDKVDWTARALEIPGATYSAIIRVGETLMRLEPKDIVYGILPGVGPGYHYGELKRLLPSIREARDIARVRDGFSVAKWLRTVDPSALALLSKLEDRGLNRTEALGWLCADIGSPAQKELHPMLTGDVSRLALATISSLVQNRYLRSGDMSRFHARAFLILESYVLRSEAVRVLYSW